MTKTHPTDYLTQAHKYKPAVHSYIRIYLCHLVISAALLLPSFTRPCYAELDKNLNYAQLMFTLGNKDALMEDRQAALAKLAEEPTDGFRDVLFEILLDKGESRILHNSVSQILISTNDSKLNRTLQDKLMDSKENAYIREHALYSLWMKDPEPVTPMIRRIVENPYENESFRLTAFTYLASAAGQTETKELAKRLFLSRTSSMKIRNAAVNIIEASGDTDAILSMYRDTMSNMKEDPTLRQIAIAKGQLRHANEIEGNLLAVLKNPREKPDMRIVALDALALNTERIPELLPQITELYHLVPDVQLRARLKEIIGRYEEPDSPADAPIPPAQV